MVKFLLQRPIAVLMAFTACFVLGIVTYSILPVSLLPDIPIPEITVQVTAENTSARELENTIVKPVRQQLMQVGVVRNMTSEVRDGSAVIRLSFNYGTNTDLSFIEVNEKIDAAMSYLPREIERPRVIKASATDLPVLYLNLTLKENATARQPDNETFLELSEFANQVIKRRLEQLPEVAMVDQTGGVSRQLQIIPRSEIMQIMGLAVEDLEEILVANNIEPGSMTVKDGHYEYNIRFSVLLRTVEDVRNIHFKWKGQLFQLKDVADVRMSTKGEMGASLYNGRRAVTLAVIKQSEENMDQLKEALKSTIAYFTALYPEVEFTISRNQTELLDYTISNLQQNLALGFLFIFLVAILFLGDVRSPVIIALSMLVSLVVSFTLFYLFGMSLNIISLSGLILAQGMMVDNSIIVTENIVQYRERGYNLEEACSRGTSEVITPMLSSSLTTIAIFIPLVFLSGIAGAIFYDEALALTIGLTSSYFTGIILLPVLYKLIYGKPFLSFLSISRFIDNPVKEHTLDRFYEKGVSYFFNHKTVVFTFIALILPLCGLGFFWIEKAGMPDIDQTEMVVHIDWNENIHIEENRERVNQLTRAIENQVREHSAYIGSQQYLLTSENELSSSEAEVYFRVDKPEELASLTKEINKWITTTYPQTVFSSYPPANIFEKIFATGQPELIAEVYPYDCESGVRIEALKQLEKKITASIDERNTGLAYEDQWNIVIDRKKLLLYGVSWQEVIRTLKTAFKENNIATLRSYQQYIPITISAATKNKEEVLTQTLIRTQPDEDGNYHFIPLQAIISVSPDEDLKTIVAGKNGEYIPFAFPTVCQPEKLMDQLTIIIKEENNWDIGFSGTFFSNRKMLNELIVVLFISLLLMYFILAAQFESFVQPLIVLTEIPIDISFALLVLWLTGNTLNLMSAIGIVISCGIIVNDSILKLEVINGLRKQNFSLSQAIHEGGKRRIRAIIMTSLTTIFAMVPLLFSHDMGSELQKPLAIAMIATMSIGTLVSLFIIPLIYWAIYRK